jgi:hypothetical protein
MHLIYESGCHISGCHINTQIFNRESGIWDMGIWLAKKPGRLEAQKL